MTARRTMSRGQRRQRFPNNNTVAMAADARAAVTARPECHVAFLEHEGRFRQQAWEAMEHAFSPERDDWVFCIDADEILVASNDEALVLRDACEWATANRRGAFVVAIPEVFDCDEHHGELTSPQVRVDGFWGKIAGTRLFRYMPGGTFNPNKAMGSGSEPVYVQAVPRTPLRTMWLLHYGYARQADRQAKYERYTGMGDHGHASAHVQSIVATPELVRWDGPTVDQSDETPSQRLGQQSVAKP